MRSLPHFLAASSFAMALFLSGCAAPTPAPRPELRKVDTLETLPGLAERMDRQLGNDFVLHHLPREARTLETGFAHLIGEKSSRPVREELTKEKTVYGGEITVRRRDATLVFFLYAADPRFTDVLVYVVGDANGRHWGVYLCRR